MFIMLFIMMLSFIMMLFTMIHFHCPPAVRDSKFGHHLLLPPTSWCPKFASRTTQSFTFTERLSALGQAHSDDDGRGGGQAAGQAAGQGEARAVKLELDAAAAPAPTAAAARCGAAFFPSFLTERRKKLGSFLKERRKKRPSFRLSP